MSRRGHNFDEDDVRSRPGKNKSRPRSKDRPTHESATAAIVTTVDRGRFTIEVEHRGHTQTHFAVKARELGRKGVVVGDRVGVVGDLSGQPDSLARIVRIEERMTTLRRTADDSDPVERVIVANADQLAIVVAMADPEPRPRLIDRYIVAAYAADMAPILVLTKCDLASPDSFLAQYQALGIRSVATQRGADISHLMDLLHDHSTVFVGHSGVGKSTLVNAIVPDSELRTGDVNDVTGRGRHTSTSAVALRLPSGGWVIDTPGIRSLGLAHVTDQHIMHAFPDVEAATAGCPRGCTHDEVECALNDWAQGDTGREHLIDSVRRLLRNFHSNETY